MQEMQPPTMQPKFGRIDASLDQVDEAVEASKQHIFGMQQEDGHWVGELEADGMLEADYIFLHVLLETDDPKIRGRMQRALTEMLRYQNEDGSWSIYPGGPGNISLAVKCYFACKLMGMSAEEPLLVKSRAWIRAHGGVVKCNTFTKIYLCALGQYDYDAVPAIPPEIVLAPKWFYFNIYEISSWSRAILVPLSIAYAKKPFKKIPAERAIDELFVGGRDKASLKLRWNRDKIVSWRNFFLLLDRMVHWAERVHIRPLRAMALRRAEKWMLERFEMSDGLGAIYPAMMNAIIALRVLGYSEDDPHFIRAMDEFEKLGIDEPEGTPDYVEPTFRMQPCVSPVWDTAQMVYALGEAGVSRTDPRLLKAADWMLAKEVRHKGDWAVKVRNAQPGGWYFEYNNEFYPDTDDSAQVLLALNKVDNPRERYQYEVSRRAIDWIFAMQCKNGGWASFDKNNTKMIFQHIPFADHNAMLDPPTVDITGRILEMLATYGYTRRDKRIERAIRVHPEGAGAGWELVRALGRELPLRHVPRPARPGGNWDVEPRTPDPAGGRVDPLGAELRRGLGRELPQLRRSDDPRCGCKHAIADGMGHPWAACGGRYTQRFCREGRALAARTAARRRVLGREHG